MRIRHAFVYLALAFPAPVLVLAQVHPAVALPAVSPAVAAADVSPLTITVGVEITVPNHASVARP